MADEKIGSLYVQLEARTKKLETQLKKTEGFSKKAGKKAGKSFSTGFESFFGGLTILFAFKKAFDFGVQAKNAARDAEETGNKFNTVFSSMEKGANIMADTFAASFGLAGSTARKLLGDTGDLLVGFGFTEEKAFKLAEEVNSLAQDLASFTNFAGGAAGASAALTKGILGETESVKALGIVLRQNTPEFREQMRIKTRLEGLTENQARAEILLAEAYKQSSKAVGDYARTKDDLANVERRVSEQVKTQMELIGQGLVPAFVGLNKVFSGWLTLYGEFLGLANAEQPLNAKALDDYADSLKGVDWRRIAKEEKEAFEILETSNKKVDEFQKRIDFLVIGRQGILTGEQEAELKLLKERIKAEQFNNRILTERHRIVTDIQATGKSDFGTSTGGKGDGISTLQKAENEAVKAFREIQKARNELKEFHKDTLAFGDIEGKGAEQLLTEGATRTPRQLEETKLTTDGLDIIRDINTELDDQEGLWADLGDAQSTAMGQLAASWASQIKLFDQANSMLQQFLNTLVQVGLQQLALSAIGTFAGGGILGLVGGAVGDLFGSTATVPTNALTTAAPAVIQTSTTTDNNNGGQDINIFTDLDGLTFTEKITNVNQETLTRESTYDV